MGKITVDKSHLMTTILAILDTKKFILATNFNV